MEAKADFADVTEAQPSDYFNRIIGHIEDIVISNDFQVNCGNSILALEMALANILLYFTLGAAKVLHE